MLQNEAEVSGLRKAVQGFPSPDHSPSTTSWRAGPGLTEIFRLGTSDFAQAVRRLPDAAGEPTRDRDATISAGGSASCD